MDGLLIVKYTTAWMSDSVRRQFQLSFLIKKKLKGLRLRWHMIQPFVFNTSIHISRFRKKTELFPYLSRDLCLICPGKDVSCVTCSDFDTTASLLFLSGLIAHIH